MEVITYALAGAAIGLLAAATYYWRKAALQWQHNYEKLEAFVKDPNVQVRDKEAEYKDSYEAMTNALEDERRIIHEAMMDTFDVLNSLPSNPDRIPVQQLQQVRNKLLTAIQISTYGRQGAGDATKK